MTSSNGGVPRILAIFTSEGIQGECQIFTRYHPDREILDNERILQEIRSRCQGIEIVGDAGATTTAEAAEKIRDEESRIDGLLLFGTPSDELLSLGLPIVAVYPLWGQWMCPFSPNEGRRVLTSFLPVIPDNDSRLFESRLDDIAAKVRLIGVLSRLKGLRVLVVTDRPVLGEYEPMQIQVDGDRDAYERRYLANLKETLGVELVDIRQRVLVERMNQVQEADAREVVQRWISQAKGLKGTNEEEVVKSARLYLAMKALLEEYDCQAITTEGYTVFQYYEGGPIPSQGLPSSQLCTEGIVATSETLIDSLVTQQIGLLATGSTGFNGDYLIDPFNEIAIVGHCECPFNPFGDDRRVPYVIRNLPLWEEGKGGACVQVDLPVGEAVTVVKVSVHDRKMSIFTGTTVSGEELFAGWDDILCRTKVAIKTRADILFRNVDWKTFGNHRVVFFGDHREKFRQLAVLMGFDVVEDDADPCEAKISGT